MRETLLGYIQEIRYMMSFMDGKNRRTYLWGMTVSALAHSLFFVSFALVIQGLVNFAQTLDYAHMYQALYILGGSLLIINVAVPGFTYLFLRSVELTMAEIREKLYRKICRLRTDYLERTHNGDLASRMNNDVGTLEETYTTLFFSMLLQLLFAVGAIVTMFVMHWQLALASVAVLLVSLAISTRFARQIRELYDRYLGVLGQMTEKFSDLLGGFQLVKLFSVGPVLSQYRQLNDELTKLATRTAHKNGMLAAVNHLVSYVTFCGMVGFGALLHMNGLIAMGTVVAMAVLQISLTHTILGFGTTLSLTQNSLAGMQRIKEVLDAPEEPERLGAYVSGEPSLAMVEFRNVGFAYQEEKPVLKGLSLKIYPGEAAAIVGTSGSGKSTVIKCLLGFYPVSAGEILVEGLGIGERTLAELRGQMAYVPQEAFLFSGTVEENIRYGNPQATKEQVYEAARAAYAHDFIQELPDGYATDVGERGSALSGGQRQRIAIARALLKDAPILLLDEATSALDGESQYWVQQALQELMKGRTTIMIAHRLSTIEGADRIFVMQEGCVAEEGTHRELLARGGRYAEMFAHGSEQAPQELPAAGLAAAAAQS
ncbi:MULTISPECIES: ABC transporter ATP-binding protein [Paenibacillus]|uniref:ABC transporter ATP-binding protein n=1 Tax=Paenibacillus TaxID=44249 RepID=UPI0022B9125C|nr:ABC transporter ATP-binding protein [Paenibacillus caseinilyticus]MCZ8521903.1 ABC transporter ATP-binding protein [Paenibacillus caseinilyticus]